MFLLFPALSSRFGNLQFTMRWVWLVAGLAAARGAPIHIDVDPTNVTHTVNPLFMGCHSDSGYTHQPRGFFAQMILGEVGPMLETPPIQTTSAALTSRNWQLSHGHSADPVQKKGVKLAMMWRRFCGLPSTPTVSVTTRRLSE